MRTPKLVEVDVPTRAEKVAARLVPELNEPYFSVEPRHLAHVQRNRCTHQDHGVELDETDRTARCRGCKKLIDPFEALLHYAASERRLVGTLVEIKRRQQAEVDKKVREKARRPFLRAVTGRVARKDLSLKAEPIVGYDLTLECGHTQQLNGDRRLRRVTCVTCRTAGRMA